MNDAIVGFGKVGQALAHAFVRKNIDVTIASRRTPEELAPEARAIGSTVVAKSLRDLVQGVDVWLNNPRRPLEASGTSGQNGPDSISLSAIFRREGCSA
jgi:3-hydroxyacyl-CoA dehydrogenase